MHNSWGKIFLRFTFFICVISICLPFAYSQDNNALKKDYRNEFLIPYYIRSAGYDNTRLKDVINKFLSVNFSSFFREQNQFANGIFSEEYIRTRIYFDTIYKIDSSIYQVRGKVKIEDAISYFDGKIRIANIFFDRFTEGDETTPNLTYLTTLISKCNFRISSNQKPIAQLNGILQTILNLDTSTNKFSFYHGNNSDYYMNNTFVGIWKNRDLKQTEKCIWGIGLLPFEFTGDFKLNETYVTEKYLKNGWKFYGKLDKEGHYIENKDYWWK